MSKSFEISYFLKGLLLTIFISFIITLILGLIYYFTSVQESSIHIAVIIGFSVLAGSFFAANKSGAKGLIYGVSVGLGFFLFSLVTYYLFSDQSSSLIILVERMFICLIAGALGGTIGVIVKN